MLMDVLQQTMGVVVAEPHYQRRPTPQDALQGVLRYASRVARSCAQPGDLVLLQYDGHATHFGLYTGQGIVHACAPARRVIEQRAETLARNVVGYYRLHGVAAPGG